MGPNGSGKSTLAYVLAGRPGYEVTEGSASFDGDDLNDKET
jgi:Fe-S cluster assembly ATP-binding protein